MRKAKRHRDTLLKIFEPQRIVVPDSSYGYNIIIKALNAMPDFYVTLDEPLLASFLYFCARVIL